MNKYLLVCFFCFLIESSFGQTIQQIDSIANKMCVSLTGLKEIKEEIQVSMLFQKHLPSFFNLMKVTSQNEADSIRDKVYFRLQRNCNQFQILLQKITENKSDWAMLAIKPKLEITQKECAIVFKGGNYFYKESDGTVVNVILSENKWNETFEDGSTSTLLFIPKDNCEFDLTFIESNNTIRKNFSVKGDIYNYGISSEKDGIYTFWVIGKDNAIYSSKLYKKPN